MRQIILDGTEWKVPHDFYRSFLEAVGAPEWHGQNLDALWDSITGGDINFVDPPYLICIEGTTAMPEECKAVVLRFRDLVSEAKAQGCAVEIF